MNENPYSSMVSIMKQQSEAEDNIMVGTVTSALPLKVEIGDLQIDKDNILIADYLLKSHKRKVSLKGESISISESGASGSTGIADKHSHSITEVGINGAPVTVDAKDESSYIKTEDTLEKGDRLAILKTSDDQLYIIIARLMEV